MVSRKRLEQTRTFLITDVTQELKPKLQSYMTISRTIFHLVNYEEREQPEQTIHTSQVMKLTLIRLLMSDIKRVKENAMDS